MKTFLIISFVLMGLIFMISCDREMGVFEEKVVMNTLEADNRSTAFDSSMQTLVDSNLARLLNQDERKWWMYHYEVQTYGSSSIVAPSSNPFLLVPPPDGSTQQEPLVVVCHRHEDGSLGCYGIWSINSCLPQDLDGLDCCDLNQGDCEGEACLCRFIIET